MASSSPSLSRLRSADTSASAGTLARRSTRRSPNFSKRTATTCATYVVLPMPHYHSSPSLRLLSDASFSSLILPSPSDLFQPREGPPTPSNSLFGRRRRFSTSPARTARLKSLCLELGRVRTTRAAKTRPFGGTARIPSTSESGPDGGGSQCWAERKSKR
jgi:hypothetical protein